MLTLKMKQACPLSALLAVLAAVPLAAQAPSSYVNFEGAQVNPVRISADGTLSVLALANLTRAWTLKLVRFSSINLVSVSGERASS